MKYKYYDVGKRLLAESDSPIQFNKVLFPTWADIEPVVESKTETKKSRRNNNSEEDE